MSTTTSITELDRLADAFVAQDRISVLADAEHHGVLGAAEYLRSIAAQQGGHWAPLDSDKGQQALADAIRDLR
jgi:hypothetical protein